MLILHYVLVVYSLAAKAVVSSSGKSHSVASSSSMSSALGRGLRLGYLVVKSTESSYLVRAPRRGLRFLPTRMGVPCSAWGDISSKSLDFVRDLAHFAKTRESQKLAIRKVPIKPDSILH